MFHSFITLFAHIFLRSLMWNMIGFSTVIVCAASILLCFAELMDFVYLLIPGAQRTWTKIWIRILHVRNSKQLCEKILLCFQEWKNSHRNVIKFPHVPDWLSENIAITSIVHMSIKYIPYVWKLLWKISFVPHYDFTWFYYPWKFFECIGGKVRHPNLNIWILNCKHLVDEENVTQFHSSIVNKCVNA